MMIVVSSSLSVYGPFYLEIIFIYIHVGIGEIVTPPLETPTRQTSASPVSTIEVSFDNLSFANSDLAIILKQIVDLALDPLSTIYSTVLDK